MKLHGITGSVNQSHNQVLNTMILICAKIKNRMNKQIKPHRLENKLKKRTFKAITPDQISTDITKTLHTKAKVLIDIKHSQPQPPTPPQPSEELSQSELHLRATMGDDFHSEATIKQNISVFLEKYESQDENNERTREEQDKLIAQAEEIILHEKTHPNEVFFYHAVSSEIAYIYMIYQKVYQLFAADSDRNTFRVDHPLFHRCANISAFINYFKNTYGSEYDYHPGYIECALSANIFLFGEYLQSSEGEYTIAYYTHNRTSAKCDIQKTLCASFQSMGVSEETLRQLAELAPLFFSYNQGHLYQMSFPKEEVDSYACITGVSGYLKPLSTSKDKKDIPKVTELLDALQNETLEEESLYVDTAQARVMTPPQAPITVRQYDWNTLPMPSDAHKAFTEKFDELTNKIVFDIIKFRQSSRQYYQLNSKAPLIRYLSEINQQVGFTPSDALISDATILHLIQSADFKSIKAIVKKHPDYKNKPLTSQAITYNNRSKKDNDTKTLLERLIEPPDSVEAIHAIFGARFYEEKLEKFSFSRILPLIPDDERLPFVTTHEGKIQDCGVLAEILHELPEKSRLAFATNHQDKIANGRDLAIILKSLPEDNRLPFLMEHQHKIRNYADEVLKIVVTLPEKDQLDFAITHPSIIRSIITLIDFLKKIPKPSRYFFAKNHQNKIENDRELRQVLSLFSEEDKVLFEQEYHAHKSTNINPNNFFPSVSRESKSDSTENQNKPNQHDIKPKM